MNRGFKTLLRPANVTLGPDATVSAEIHKHLVHIKENHKHQINHYDKQNRELMAILLCARVNKNK